MSSRNIFTPLYLKAEASSHTHDYHCVEGVRIRSYSGPYFPAFGLYGEIRSISSVRIRENTDQNNFEYGHFLRSVLNIKQLVITILYIICVNILTWYHLGTYIVDMP